MSENHISTTDSYSAAIAIELKESIVTLAGQYSWSDRRKTWLSRAARRAGITPRTASAIFYGEIDDPKYSVVMRIRAAVAKMNKEQEHHATAEFADLDNAFVPHAVRARHADGR